MVGQQAALEAGESAIGIETAEGLIHRNAALVGRVGGVELKGSTQVAGGGSLKSAGTLRKHDAAHVFVCDGAADVQPVPVAIGHIAQRDVVQRKTKLILIEAAYRDAN